MRAISLFAVIFAAACTASDPGNGNGNTGGNTGCETNETCETTGPAFSATIDVILPADPATVSVVLDQNANGEIDDNEPSFPVDNCTTASCSHTVNAPGSYLVDAECVELLYHPVTVGISVGNQTTIASWVNYGDYGPAITDLECSGTYDDDGTDAGDVTVNVESWGDRGITVRGLPTDAVPTLGYDFQLDTLDGEITRGNISPNHSTITYEDWIDSDISDSDPGTLRFSITYACGS